MSVVSPSKGFFTQLRVLTRHPRILSFSFLRVFLYIFRTRGSVRIRWRPEITCRLEMRRHPDITESPSTGSGGQSSVLCPDGLPVYREILCPHNTEIQSSRLSIHIFQHVYPGPPRPPSRPRSDWPSPPPNHRAPHPFPPPPCFPPFAAPGGPPFPRPL